MPELRSRVPCPTLGQSSGCRLFYSCPFPSPDPPPKPRGTFPLFGFSSAWLCGEDGRGRPGLLGHRGVTETSPKPPQWHTLVASLSSPLQSMCLQPLPRPCGGTWGLAGMKYASSLAALPPGEGDGVPPSLSTGSLLSWSGRGALGRLGACLCLWPLLHPAFLPASQPGAACGGVWSDKAKEPSSASPLPSRHEVGGDVPAAETLPQGASLGAHRAMVGMGPPARGTSGYSPEEGGEGGGNRIVAKAIMLFRSPWQPLPWTAPHQRLAAVAQATHGLSWLLQLWGTQDLGGGGAALAGLWQPDRSSGGMMG